MKKLILVSLLPLSLCANDGQKAIDRDDLVELRKLTLEEKNKSTIITPELFIAEGKEFLATRFNTWVSAAVQHEVPCDHGMARVYFDAQSAGIDAVMKDTEAFKRANVYLQAYQDSNVASIERDMANWIKSSPSLCKVPGMRQLGMDLKTVLKFSVLHSILYGREEATEIPAENLMKYYCSDLTEDFAVILELNQGYSLLNAPAIRGLELFLAYKYQQDLAEHKE